MGFWIVAHMHCLLLSASVKALRCPRGICLPSVPLSLRLFLYSHAILAGRRERRRGQSLALTPCRQQFNTVGVRRSEAVGDAPRNLSFTATDILSLCHAERINYQGAALCWHTSTH